MHVLGGLKLGSSLEILDAELKDVEDVAIENAPKHQIIGSFLLMTADSEQTAVILDRLVLDQTGVVHWHDIVGVSHKHLHSLSTLHQL